MIAALAFSFKRDSSVKPQGYFGRLGLELMNEAKTVFVINEFEDVW